MYLILTLRPDGAQNNNSSSSSSSSRGRTGSIRTESKLSSERLAVTQESQWVGFRSQWGGYSHRQLR